MKTEPKHHEGTIALWLAAAACLFWWAGWPVVGGSFAFLAFFAFAAR